MENKILKRQIFELTKLNTEKLDTQKQPNIDIHKLYKIFDIKIDELELSVRSSNCLKNENISYVGELVQKTEIEMLKTPNCGNKSFNEVKNILVTMGLRFNMDASGWIPKNSQ